MNEILDQLNLKGFFMKTLKTLKTLKALVLVAGLIGVAALPTLAISTISGPTGLIEVPTAESLRYREVSLGYDYIFDATRSDYKYRFSLGLFNDLEAGVTGGKVPTEGVFVNFKYHLVSEASRFPLAMAVGLNNLGSKSVSSVYMVMSKKFQGGVNGTFGFNAMFKPDVLDLSVMGGIEYIVSNKVSILADVSAKDKTYIVNGGINVYITPELVVRYNALGLITDATAKTSTGIQSSVGVVYTRFL